MQLRPKRQNKLFIKKEHARTYFCWNNAIKSCVDYQGISIAFIQRKEGITSFSKKVLKVKNK